MNMYKRPFTHYYYYFISVVPRVFTATITTGSITLFATRRLTIYRNSSLRGNDHHFALRLHAAILPCEGGFH